MFFGFFFAKFEVITETEKFSVYIYISIYLAKDR
jgi:hypothetical protein